jgi:hypothetical protein
MSEYGQPDPNRPFVPEHGIIENSPLNPNHTSSQHQAPKRHTGRNILIAVGAVVAVVVGAAALAPGQPAKAPTAVTSKAGTPVVTSKPSAAKPSTQPSPRVTHKPAPPMTASQVQAIGSAESYLSFTAFSRKGLIHQLSSDAGEGFSVKDATFAVDHITVDWNEQAAKSALSYLSMEHFSRKGLIHQLESAYGEQFTHAQAVYGVTKAGL